MLNFLAIDNVVLIEKAEIDFSSNKSGLCILSGETGSGKSILLDAFGLAIGFRSNLRLIGSCDDKASVFAEFDISNNNFCKNILSEHSLLSAENPSELRIRRIIQKNSSSKTYVNDQIIGVNLLAKIGETLVEIHGQHDSRGLLNPSFHEKILDEFAKNENLLTKLKEIYKDLKVIEEKIAEIEEKKQSAIREKDYLQYIIEELEKADIKKGEEDDLLAQKDSLKGKEKILDFTKDLARELTNANSNLISAQNILIRNTNIIENYLKNEQEIFSNLSENIDENNIALESAIAKIEDLQYDLNANDGDLSQIENRLFEIKRLSRKFNTTSDDLSEIVEDAMQKISLIDDDDKFSKKLLKEKQEKEKEFLEIAENIHQRRQKEGLRLAKKVEDELKFLRMENVKFKVDVKKNSEKISESGFDIVRFSASINNNDFDEITKIASGGELSRFMLALKVALIDVKSTPTMIFDEIDTGIGGKTADAVGKRLKTLSRNFQIFVVTHQPQIAAKADLHFSIQKSQNKNKIKTTIEKLEKESQNQEIARMISGEDISEESLAAAKILLNNQ